MIQASGISRASPCPILFRPFGAGILESTEVPRAMPWAVLSRPFRAKRIVRPKQETLQRTCVNPHTKTHYY
jgi:hypothetical protein